MSNNIKFSEVAGVLNDLNTKLASENGEHFFEELKKLLRGEFVMERDECVYTRLISGSDVILDPTDGKETMAKAGDLFTSYLDSDFENYGTDVPSSPTGKMRFAVHEMIKDGTFAQIFSSMSDDLNSLCLTQPQIIQFVKNHRIWLHTDDPGTFFLFKGGDEFFVAYVRVDDAGGIKAYVHRLSHDRVWGAEHRRRVVVPQETLES